MPTPVPWLGEAWGTNKEVGIFGSFHHASVETEQQRASDPLPIPFLAECDG